MDIKKKTPRCNINIINYSIKKNLIIEYKNYQYNKINKNKLYINRITKQM